MIAADANVGCADTAWSLASQKPAAHRLERVMHCLWLTLADPDPATNGQLIYSKGLIEAARDAGATLRVIGLARRENPRTVRDLLGIDWRLADEEVQSPWRRLLSPVPVVAHRGNAPNMHEAGAISARQAISRVVRLCRRRLLGSRAAPVEWGSKATCWLWSVSLSSVLTRSLSSRS